MICLEKEMNDMEILKTCRTFGNIKKAISQVLETTKIDNLLLLP